MKIRSIDLSSGIRLAYEDSQKRLQTKTVTGTRIRLLSAPVADELDAIAHDLGGHASFLRRTDGSYVLNLGPEHVDLSKVD